VSFVISFGPEYDRHEELHVTLKEAADRCRELLAARAENITIKHRGKVFTPSMIIVLSPGPREIPGI
jgi:hypothetical protein